MVKKQSESKRQSRKIEFLLYAPHAQNVSLLGDSNQWDGERMNQDLKH